MLNRRHLRIRVLQFVYSWNKSKSTDIVDLEKQFIKSLKKVEELYILLLLLYLLEVRDFAENYLEDAKNKQLPSEEDLNPNTKFIDNLFLEKLKESSLLKSANLHKVSFSDQKNIIKSVYFNIINSDIYKDYINDKEVGFELDKKFILKLFSKELIEMEVFQDFLNEQDIFWDDDLPFIASMVIKTIKDSTMRQTNNI